MDSVNPATQIPKQNGESDRRFPANFCTPLQQFIPKGHVHLSPMHKDASSQPGPFPEIVSISTKRNTNSAILPHTESLRDANGYKQAKTARLMPDVKPSSHEEFYSGALRSQGGIKSAAMESPNRTRPPPNAEESSRYWVQKAEAVLRSNAKRTGDARPDPLTSYNAPCQSATGPPPSSAYEQERVHKQVPGVVKTQDAISSPRPRPVQTPRTILPSMASPRFRSPLWTAARGPMMGSDIGCLPMHSSRVPYSPLRTDSSWTPTDERLPQDCTISAHQAVEPTFADKGEGYTPRSEEMRLLAVTYHGQTKPHISGSIRGNSYLRDDFLGTDKPTNRSGPYPRGPSGNFPLASLAFQSSASPTYDQWSPTPESPAFAETYTPNSNKHVPSSPSRVRAGTMVLNSPGEVTQGYSGRAHSVGRNHPDAPSPGSAANASRTKKASQRRPQPVARIGLGDIYDDEAERDEDGRNSEYETWLSMNMSSRVRGSGVDQERNAFADSFRMKKEDRSKAGPDGPIYSRAYGEATGPGSGSSADRTSPRRPLSPQTMMLSIPTPQPSSRSLFPRGPPPSRLTLPLPSQEHPETSATFPKLSPMQRSGPFHVEVAKPTSPTSSPSSPPSSRVQSSMLPPERPPLKLRIPNTVAVVPHDDKFSPHEVDGTQKAPIQSNPRSGMSSDENPTSAERRTFLSFFKRSPKSSQDLSSPRRSNRSQDQDEYVPSPSENRPENRLSYQEWQTLSFHSDSFLNHSQLDWPEQPSSTNPEFRVQGFEPRRVVITVHREEPKLKRLERQLQQIPSIARDVNGMPVRRYWLGPTDELANAFGFIPLALAALTISLSFLAWGIQNITVILINDGQISWDEAGDLVVGSFKIIVAVISIIAVLARWVFGVHVLVVGYNVFLVSCCINAMMKTMEWGMAHHKKTHIFTAADTRFIVSYYVFFVFILVTQFVVIGMLHSLKMVLAVGGTGWENKNYLEIRFEREMDLRRNRLRQQMSSLSLTSSASSRKLLDYQNPKDSLESQNSKSDSSSSDSGSGMSRWLDGKTSRGLAKKNSLGDEPMVTADSRTESDQRLIAFPTKDRRIDPGGKDRKRES